MCERLSVLQKQLFLQADVSTLRDINIILKQAWAELNQAQTQSLNKLITSLSLPKLSDF